jgi:hypothetical protein
MISIRTLANNFIGAGLSTFGLAGFARAGKICILGFALTEVFALMMAVLILVEV